jgi:3-deoxy-D-manno-octulosonate 8-phosphate phosphatase (KDO 8-P phosphatase)
VFVFESLNDIRMISDPHIRARASKIKLLLMDVDGVLTNGKLYHFPDKEGDMIETKGFDSQDGIALQWMQWKGLQTGVISGRVSLGTAERARQVKMNYVYQGHIEKVPILEKIMAEAALKTEEVAYMGDDLTDIVVMHRVGFAVAVANARPEVKREAHYVTEATGGSGAVREVIEIILDARGFWPEILEKYEVPRH